MQQDKIVKTFLKNFCNISINEWIALWTPAEAGQGASIGCSVWRPVQKPLVSLPIISRKINALRSARLTTSIAVQSRE